jgi:hypothetical protein
MHHRPGLHHRLWLSGDVTDNNGYIETALRENRIVILQHIDGQLTMQVSGPREEKTSHGKPEHDRTHPLRSQRIPGRRR